jgi:hypothetical protein
MRSKQELKLLQEFTAGILWNAIKWNLAAEYFLEAPVLPHLDLCSRYEFTGCFLL